MKTNVIRLYERALRDERNILFTPCFYRGVLPDNETVNKVLLSETWNKMSQCRGESVLTSLAAEKCVLELVRRGVTRDRIRYCDGAFRVRLEHIQCEILREGHSCFARFCGDQFATKWKAVNVSPEEIADLLLEFDASIPEMTRRTGIFYEEFLEMARLDKKKEMMRQIVLTTLRSKR